MVFSIFTNLCTHHHYLIPEYFYHPQKKSHTHAIILHSFKILISEREREGERRGRETPLCGYLLSTPYWGPVPQPRHVLTGNQTSNPLVYRLALNPLSHASQGSFSILSSHNH